MNLADNTVAGPCARAGAMTYRVVKEGRIESVTGKTPRCRHCGKRLRPNYANEYQETTKRYLYPQKPDGPGVEFDELRGKWRKTFVIRKLVGRKFLGTFGKQGDGFFCSQVCAGRWAVAMVARIENGAVQLVEIAPPPLDR